MSDENIWVEVTDRPIDTIEAGRALAADGHGAQVMFLGVVRNENLGRSVSAVSYDAHRALTEDVFRKLCLEAQAKWGAGLRALIVHRVGRLEVGEASVVIGVSLPHRDETYEASRYLIEELKVRAPIWKKEHYLDGDSEWLPGHSLCRHGHAKASGDRHDHDHGHGHAHGESPSHAPAPAAHPSSIHA